MNNTQKKNIKKKIEEVIKNSRFTEEELSLISNTFFEKDELLMTIRKHFLQFNLDEQEAISIKGINENTLKVIRKQLLPEIDPTSPMFQNRDLWVSVNTTEKLAEDSYLDMRAQDIAIRYLEEQFDRIEGNFDISGIQLKDLVYNDKKNEERAFIDLKARNTLLTHIDANLQDLRTLAISNSKVDIDEKLRKLDSNK